MDKKHYNMMDWESIESIVYADCDKPFEILSVTKKGKSKLIQAFYPNAEKVSAVFNCNSKNKTVKLEKVDENGFFAEFIDFEFDSYTFKIEYENEIKDKVYDPYFYPVSIDTAAVRDIIKGKSRNAYKHLGSHRKKYGNVEGYEFTVYAPNALCVALVGDFNNWVENANLMERDSNVKGLFKLFVPGLEDYSVYKYIINCKGNKTYKLDPFALGIDGDNSVCVPASFADRKPRKEECPSDLEFQVLEVDINNFFKKYKDEKAVFEYLHEHALKYSYNAISFVHLFKSNNPNDVYEIINPYSLDVSNGLTTDKLKTLIHNLKAAGILSFIEIPLAYASDCESGLVNFDGACLFENTDSRLSSHKFYKAMLYDYTCSFTKSYLLSAVNYYFNDFDFNGYVLSNAGVIIYHDYNKNPGEFVTEQWGSTLHSQGVCFIREVNRYIHKEYKNALCIASIYAYYKDVTGKGTDSLCFDYCMNTGACEEILDFLRLDPSFRRDKLDSFLLFTHFTNNDEKYIYPYSRKENTKDFASIYDKMPGDKIQKLSNLKMAIIFKHLLYGAQYINIDIDELESADNDVREAYNKFYDDFRRIYVSSRHRIRNFNAEKPFSYKCIDNQVFTREYFDGTKDFIIVFNFSNDSYQKYNIPVSHAGVYKEVFNSDSKVYLGEGVVNVKQIQTQESEGMTEHTVTVKLPALSIVAFEYREFTQKELDAIFLKKKKAMYKYVDGEKKKVKDKLNADIEILKKDADERIKELEKLLEPFNK
ncbi:MAG: alpha amylase C-terminal domain-containing protein [Lachnospiraceae bacterium]|nr:alpha amylase C-terminal domain-containing protein [Lachnospiraceae bacterium]